MKLGTHIFGELVAAGLVDLPIGINLETGEVTGVDALAKRQAVTLQTVIDAHDPDAVMKRRVGSPREFLRLFTPAERTMFFTAVKDSPQLQEWWAFASGGDFSLDHGDVGKGLAAMVKAGLLTEERAAEILAADFDDVGG